MVVVGVPKESFPGERRVAMVPALVGLLKKSDIEVIVESNAGAEAGFTDEAYKESGAAVVASRAEVFDKSQVIVQVRTPGANPAGAEADLGMTKANQLVLGFSDPLGNPEAAKPYADKAATLLSMEMIPRITRAQSMDALSSMATIAGYRAVLDAAVSLPKMFPMMMTAAGTVKPAKVFVIGAGVAGLQACATAKRLGAVVSAFDVRAAVKEQVQSVGAKFIELEVEKTDAEDKGGYAKELGEEFYKKQRELMSQVVADADVVITTAAIPGRKSPVLVTEEMIKGMRPGSVIVDLAAERGGNCEGTEADKTVVKHGVTILGPTNISTSVPHHASQMYAKNIATLLTHLVKDGTLTLDLDDEITRGIVVTHKGSVVHERIAGLLGIEPPKKAKKPPADTTSAVNVDKAN